MGSNVVQPGNQMGDPAAKRSCGDSECLLTDEDVAILLAVQVDWVRSHACDIPGFRRLGVYYRFHRSPVADWLGGLEVLLKPDDVALLLRVPKSWVYSNSEEIPGFIRLGRYVRFRPGSVRNFLSGSTVAQ
jgi:hypothetical protein